nr:hypothetical protein [Nanoarchaeota archaeon]
MVEPVNVALPAAGLVVLIIAMVWTMIWTGIALWRSAKNNQIAWFIVLFLINTLGILEIIYLAFFQRNKNIAMPVVIKEKAKPAKKVVRKKKK